MPLQLSVLEENVQFSEIGHQVIFFQCLSSAPIVENCAYESALVFRKGPRWCMQVLRFGHSSWAPKDGLAKPSGANWLLQCKALAHAGHYSCMLACCLLCCRCASAVLLCRCPFCATKLPSCRILSGRQLLKSLPVIGSTRRNACVTQVLCRIDIMHCVDQHRFGTSCGIQAVDDEQFSSLGRTAIERLNGAFAEALSTCDGAHACPKAGTARAVREGLGDHGPFWTRDYAFGREALVSFVSASFFCWLWPCDGCHF